MADKIAVYPGSFNPWHEGHEDILKKALCIFDKIIVMQGHNPTKPEVKDKSFFSVYNRYKNVEASMFSGLLADAIEKIQPCAIIRGLRNGYDLEYETNLQYWNEDLGIKVPTVYFITDRQYSHISSTAIRELNYTKKEKFLVT